MIIYTYRIGRHEMYFSICMSDLFEVFDFNCHTNNEFSFLHLTDWTHGKAKSVQVEIKIFNWVCRSRTSHRHNAITWASNCYLIPCLLDKQFNSSKNKVFSTGTNTIYYEKFVQRRFSSSYLLIMIFKKLV